ncbi:MAG: fumarylacetoacetate hydrolase family protein [Alphaproteobacteria bacterium]|nr:fumarylacetoacetate hydrolase family protein [Alphaproteobacteria bacterium]
MKFVSYRVVNRESWGVMGSDGGVIDLCAEFGNTMPTLRDYLAASDAEKAKVAEYCDTGFGGTLGKSSDFPASDIILREPITNPHAIFCVGLNYRKHAEETGNKLPKKPILFPRWPASHVAHGQPMLAPKESEMFDFEGELAVIMGKTARRVSEAAALDYVGGYSIYNDGSIRDWQRHTTQFLPGKNFYHSGSFGPWMVSADEIPDPSALHLETRLNGETVQSEGVNDLIFNVPQLIAYISTMTELRPGDVIVTGTPSGVGLARSPQLWMKPGDTVEVEISKIGILSNTIEAD